MKSKDKYELNGYFKMVRANGMIQGILESSQIYLEHLDIGKENLESIMNALKQVHDLLDEAEIDMKTSLDIGASGYAI